MPRMGLDEEMILSAAAELADRHGLDGVTLAALARQLNVRPPSLYNHIDGLPALRQQLAAYGLEQLHRAMLEASNRHSGKEAVLQAGMAYAAFVRQHPGVYEATLRATGMPAAGQSIVDLAVRLLADFELEERHVIHAVRGLRSLLHGFASLEQGGGFRMEIAPTESLRWILEAYLAGLAKA
ncbi:TetR/AcrR family transcriptional regulator [Ectobacillus ponti]|uniref:WHG domain-containing protein n=1 Tax=Ectobacillus ponti TaxID=2961894 RepID=A0AA41X2B5_9BACI|nr:TetR/AcrR family transcriptional regulator [Ectobacillus ponti]MCP8967634.1 WHG domain-containing protein [Ectobacillus ponti]